MSPAVVPMIGFGAQEILLILLVLVLLFGAKKLPELARGSGRALRIFKSETKGLLDEDDDVEEKKADEQKRLDTPNRTAEAHVVEDTTEPHRASPQHPTDSDR